ncbi:MAG: hypothetical protein IT466_05710, partial [Moraxellaceae bacterium]|nr:hypothetical protein [Moraxellaceae bacterium]
ITSIFHASYGNPDQTLSCTSTGAIEALLLPLIKEAVLSMPDEVPLAYPTISKETASPYEAQEVQLNNTPKKPSDAVEIADITMNLREVNYSDAVAMTIHYKSKTSKRIIGVVSRITASNVFGQQVLSDLFEDEIVIEPGELTSGGSFWNWKDNPYIQNEPYDRMWQSVKNYTIKTKATVLKVIFDDGTKVEAATQAPKKRK